MDGKAWGPAAIAAAAGVRRGVLHSWLARKYLSWTPSPGMGIERTFDILDAVRIAVVGELTRLGLTVGSAFRAAGLIQERMLVPPPDRRWALIIAPPKAKTEDNAAPEELDDAAPADDDAVKLGSVGLQLFQEFGDIANFASRYLGDPPAFIFMDLTRTAARVRAALEQFPAEPRVTYERVPPA
jgi:hypothetical protein